MHKNTTHTSHHTPKRTEGTIIFCFFLSHRRTPSGRKWMNVHMKRSNSCLLCYTVCDYNFHYSTSPHTPYGALFFQLFPYPCIVCDIIFYYFASLAPTQDGSSARRVCLETMLSRWKEQVKWEKREEDKKRKRECVWGLFFFLFLSAAVHGFLISSEITERDEFSRVANPSTRASPAHPRARMELHEFPLLLFNGDGYPNKWAAFAWLSTAGSH